MAVTNLVGLGSPEPSCHRFIFTWSIETNTFSLTPDTNQEQFIEYLKPNLSMEKLQSRHPEQYSPFRIDVKEEQLTVVFGRGIRE